MDNHGAANDEARPLNQTPSTIIKMTFKSEQIIAANTAQFCICAQNWPLKSRFIWLSTYSEHVQLDSTGSSLHAAMTKDANVMNANEKMRMYN